MMLTRGAGEPRKERAPGLAFRPGDRIVAQSFAVTVGTTVLPALVGKLVFAELTDHA